MEVLLPLPGSLAGRPRETLSTRATDSYTPVPLQSSCLLIGDLASCRTIIHFTLLQRVLTSGIEATSFGALGFPASMRYGLAWIAPASPAHPRGAFDARVWTLRLVSS
jgi:hypothetical protein